MTMAEQIDTDYADELEAAFQRVEETETRVEQFGQDALEELADAYERFVGLLDRYEDQVVGDAGDYETNIQFQGEIAELTSDISSDMLLYETFEECDEHLQQRYFNQHHFDHVREQLEPVGDMVQRLYDYEKALEEYRSLRRELDYEIRDLEKRIQELERLSRLGTADLEAPTERLRDPIETYNDAVADAFQEFQKEATARELIQFLAAMEDYPLVPFETPPTDLQQYLESEPPGTEQVSTLLEYAQYSTSKLEHYVDDPDRLKHVIGGRKTFLSGLDAQPLQIQWPPPSATELTYRCQELTAAVNRFAPKVVEQLRTVEALPRETDYERLRTSVLAQEDLSQEERAEIQAGAVEEKLEEARQRLDELQDVYESFPDL